MPSPILTMGLEPILEYEKISYYILGVLSGSYLHKYYDVIACSMIYLCHVGCKPKEVENRVLSVQEGESWPRVPNAVVLH